MIARGTGSDHQAGHPPRRFPDRRVDETRLNLLLERTYAARAARLPPPDAALTNLNAALDAISAPPHRRMDHCRRFGVCALAGLILLVLSSVGLSEFAVGMHNAAQSVAPPMHGAVSGDTHAARATVAAPPLTVAASDGDTTIGHAPLAGTAPAAGMSKTPLRDLLARAGIHASDPPGAPARAGDPPPH